MKIIASMASCANNTERVVMRCFYEGMVLRYFQQYNTDSFKSLARHHNISLSLEYEANIGTCDLAIQFGAAKDRSIDHHVARQNIRQNARHIMFIETPVIGRQINNKNDYEYYRIGLDGFLNDQGLNMRRTIDPTRCIEVRQALGIPEFPGWKDASEGNILILLQLPGDASLRRQSLAEWLSDTIDYLRSRTSRSIVIRLHPTMSSKSLSEFMSDLAPMIVKNYVGIHWSDGKQTSLEQDLDQAGIAITYSSGSSVDAVLRGVPVIACDAGCLAYPVGGHHLDEIDDLVMAGHAAVMKWLDALCMNQWTAVEMRQGRVWEYYQPAIDEILAT